MKISAHLSNSLLKNEIQLQTNEKIHSITITPKESGFGSKANGGELLFLALATCYCNDIYREAAKKGMKIEKVDVNVEGHFGSEGDPALNITYSAKVTAEGNYEEIIELMKHTDQVSEIQNTLRKGIPVILDRVEVIRTQ